MFTIGGKAGSQEFFLFGLRISRVVLKDLRGVQAHQVGRAGPRADQHLPGVVGIQLETGQEQVF